MTERIATTKIDMHWYADGLIELQVAVQGDEATREKLIGTSFVQYASTPENVYFVLQSKQWDMSSIPDQVLMSEVGRRNSRKRKKFAPGPGRPILWVGCLGCRQTMPLTEFKHVHKCSFSGGTS